MDLGIAWFGEPPDSDRTFGIIRGSRSMCIDANRGSYIIVIDAEYEHSQQQLAALAHEMYHRLTGHCSGLRESIWVDEMLAFLFSHHALLEFGEDTYAQQRIEHFQNRTNDMSLVEVQSVCKRRSICQGEAYPPGFGKRVIETGIQLTDLVGWSHVRDIVKCRSWDEWLSGLPIELRGSVRTLLNIPG